MTASRADIEAQIRELVEKLAPRPLAKASGSLRDEARSESCASFVVVIDQLSRASGGSHARVADKLTVDKTTLSDWLTHGDTSRKQIPLWVLYLLPREARAEFMRQMLTWDEPESLRRVG